MPRWFRKKRWGYGWTPCAWQGWLVTALFAAIVIAISQPRVMQLDRSMRMAAVAGLVVLLLVVIAFTSGRDSDA